MKRFLLTIRSRWRNAMPVFFRRVCWTASMVSGSALAVNAAFAQLGAVPPQWWQDISAPLIAFSAGIAFAAKFTQQYSGQPISKVSDGPAAVDDNKPVEIPLPDIEPLNANDL